MDRDFDRFTSTATQPEDDPETKWVAWGVWSGLSLVAVLLAIFVGGFDPGLLLGWVVGIIIAAVLMVFRR
jgi:hypothetical protein